MAQADLISGLTEIWSQTLHRFSGEEAPPIVPPDPSDKRFSSPDWSNNPFFDCLRQSYTLTTRWANDMVEHDRGPRSADESQGGFLHAPDLQRDVAVQFRGDQSRIAARDAGGARRQSGARHGNAGRGSLGGRRHAENPPVRRQQIPAWRRYGDDARQGGPAQRIDGADPIFADDERGLRAPAADRPAVDQQILRARSQPRKKLRALGGGAGVDGVHHLLGQPRREQGRPRLRSLYARGRAHRARRDRTRDRRKQGRGGGLLRRRHAARLDARPIWRPSATSASTA